MTNRLFYKLAAPGMKSTITPEKGASHGGYGAATQSEGTHTDLHTLFQQLAQSLTVLGGACELVLDGNEPTSSTQAQRIWLQPHARQAERVMHQLRNLRLTKSSCVTELSQSLTVLVLAADMLAQGQLTGDDALAFYGLLRRNAAVATKSLIELRMQFDPEARALYQ